MVLIVKKLLAVLLSFLSFFFSPLLGNFTSAFAPADEENVRMVFAAIADIHMTESVFRSGMLELGLDDMANSAYPLDALVVAGDMTDGGEAEQYEMLRDTFGRFTPAKNIILSAGNHDTWTDIEVPGTIREYFTRYTGQITGRAIDEMYYATEVNGYHFIVLGSEGDGVSAYISDTQLSWLAAAMEEASQDGRPIFVISHWPMNGTHGLPESWGDENPQPEDGGFGGQSAQIEAILKQYDNVFLISGHVHLGLTNKYTENLYSYKTVETYGSVHSVNLPVYMYANMPLHGTSSNGTGCVFEVYDDEVVIRGRSFSAGVWYTLYTWTIPLV